MSAAAGRLRRRVRARSATALVVANIIGAGIFTTTGFQAAEIGDPRVIYLLWIVGGVLALCGALCYAELGAAMPQAGGEYVYLRRAFGPGLAFMSAFVSLVAGFSAPIAAAAKSFFRYAQPFLPETFVEQRLLGIPGGDLAAIALVWALVALHLRVSGGFAASDALTLLKLVGIVGLLLGAFAFGRGSVSRMLEPAADLGQAASLAPALGTSLVFVMFCYSGWNAAAYIAGEMEAPQRDLPRSLVGGTVLVVVLYLALNVMFFWASGVSGLAGEVEVGLVAARDLFGDVGVRLSSAVIGVSILASISAMTIAGPRVYYAFGRDFKPLNALAGVSAGSGAPTFALVLQGTVTSALILSGRVDQIQQYAGFTLSLFASLAVLSLMVLRWREPQMERPFRTWGYPLTPLLFLTVSAWMMFWAFAGRPLESILALLTVVLGGLVFLGLSRWGGGEVAEGS